MLRTIKKRVKKMEDQLGPQGVPVILVQPGETTEAAQKRHLQEHPHHRECTALMFIITRPGGEPGRGAPPRPGSEGPPTAPLNGASTDKPLQITH
jgi:hypothetical protein